MALDNPATHLRCHCDRFERGIPADFVEIFRNILRGRLRHRDQWWRRGRSAACTSLRLHAAVINTLLPLIPVVQGEKMGYSLTFLSSSFSKTLLLFSKTLLFYAEAPSAENI